MPYVTAAADVALGDTFADALQLVRALASPGDSDRLLIVNDLSCGRLPTMAAKMGATPQVVERRAPRAPWELFSRPCSV